MDFGLAHRLDTAEKLTQEGTVLGTPAYMAPEQAAGSRGEPLPASDQYSLGVVLYELLCGEPPFAGPPQVVLFNAIHTEPERPRQRDASIPLDLETICLKALAKQPGDRYASCQELADDLRRWQEGEAIRARRLGPVERLGRWCRRNPLAAALAAGIAVTLAAGTVVSTYFALEVNRRAIQIAHERDRAEQEKTRADQQTAEARASTNRALVEKERADREAQRVKDEKLLSDRQLYISDMNLAQRAWDDAQINLLRELLDKHRPARADDVDLRGWEWHYLERLWHSQQLTIVGRGRRADCVAYSPDGSCIASGSSDKTVRVWDVATGRQLSELKGHDSYVSGVAYSPDGARIASASDDRTVRVWDAATGRQLRELKGHQNFVNCVVYSPDGARIASASGDTTVRVWDAATGRQLRELKGHGNAVVTVAYRPDGARIASASGDNTVRVWDASTGRQLSELKGHGDVVLGVAYSPDGSRIASASGDRTVRVWDASTGRQLLELKGHGRYVSSVAYSPDGSRIASVSGDRTVRVWDASTGRQLRELKGHGDAVQDVAYSPDGRTSPRRALTGRCGSGTPPQGRNCANSATRVLLSPAWRTPRTGRASPRGATGRCGCGTRRRAASSANSWAIAVLS